MLLTDQNVLVALRCRKYQSQTKPHVPPTYLASATNELDTGPIRGMAYDDCHKQKKTIAQIHPFFPFQYWILDSNFKILNERQ